MEYKFDIPHVVRAMAMTTLKPSKKDYIARVNAYFKSVHPDMVLIRIEGKQAVLKKER
ncbi:hypothetical protein [Domibacillus aminovorans]|uniref:hypothetical protein n=1 Tax=Domibacillus aminovorans TaxID=29332 RepID=UPI0012FD228C|nr:hypothetical protein [Domibacillus aminovorans]